MEMTLQLCRTPKGHDELFNQGHSLRPRLRQVLFSVGNGISFGELCAKLPHCSELEAMVNDLLTNGFIQALRGAKPAAASAPATRVHAGAPGAPARLGEARDYVLETMRALVGTKSPAYKQMSEAQDLDGFAAALVMCRRVVAAVASPHQADELEAGAAKFLN